MSEPASQNPAPRPAASTLAAADGAGEELDLRRLFDIVWSRGWLVIACLLLAFLVGVFDLKRTKPEYVATAVLRFDDPTPKVFDFDPQANQQGASEGLRTQIELIRSPAVAEMVLQTLGSDALRPQDDADSGALTERIMAALAATRIWFRTYVLEIQVPDIEPEILQRQLRIQGLLEGLEVEDRPKTSIIEVRYSSTRNEHAKRVADAFCRQFIAYLNESRLAATEEARAQAEVNIQDVRAKLLAAEQRLLDYKVADVKQLELQKSLVESRIKDLSSLIASRTNELVAAESEAKGLREASEEGVILSKDPFLNDFRKRYNDLQMKRATLVAEARPNHPELIQLERELVFINDQITSAVAGLQVESDIRLQMVASTLETQKQRFAEAQEELDFLNRSLLEHGAILRDVETYRKLYDEMLSRFKETAVTSAMDSVPVQIVNLADVPRFPSKPKVTQVIAIWCFLGMSFGMGLAFLLEHLDRTVKSPRDVENLLGLPTLGTIPFLGTPPGSGLLRKAKGRAIRLVTSLPPKSPEAESFRYLRTALHYSAAGSRPRTIMVTSSTPREGKSTATMNLAITVAQRGERTLLIDADLKKPVVHQTFNLARRPGLTDVLTGNHDFEECVVPSGVESKLDILPAGPSVPSSADLLDSAAMDAVLARALERYDFVMIDSPPLGGMADAYVLARRVEGVCLVARVGVTRRDVLTKSVQALDSMEARLLGVVYNTSERGRRAPSYYGYYEEYHEDAPDEEEPSVRPPKGTPAGVG